MIGFKLMLKKAASAMLGPPKVSAFLHIPGFQAADCRRAWARGQQAKASASKVGQKPIGKMKDGSSVGFFMMSEQFYCYQAFSPCYYLPQRINDGKFYPCPMPANHSQADQDFRILPTAVYDTETCEWHNLCSLQRFRHSSWGALATC